MLCAVFGAETPAEAGPDFCAQVMECVKDATTGCSLIFEQPWMTIYFSKRYPDSDISVYCFESTWPLLCEQDRWISALNFADRHIFILSPSVLTNPNGHFSSIIEQAVVALSLQREFKTNEYVAFGDLMAKRLKEP